VHRRDKVKLGFFTDGLLRAIEGRDPRADRNRDGVLEAREAFAAGARGVAANLRELRAQTGERLVQHPRLYVPRGLTWPIAALRVRRANEPFILEPEGRGEE
jgi:hypothetical protein